MKNNVFQKSVLRFCSFFLTVILVSSVFTACKENISEDAYAIKTENTIMDYINSSDSTTLIRAIFNEVKLGISDNASVMASVLSSRGNYTVFAPTDNAIRLYLDSMNVSSIDELTSDQKERIALNCVIDNGTGNAYEVSDFPNDASFPLSNLKDRRLSCKSINDEFYINGSSKVIINTSGVVTSNNEASNGMLHYVDHVIFPSTSSVAELVQANENMRIMGELLRVTNWEDSLSAIVSAEKEQAFEQSQLSHASDKKRFRDSDGDAEWMAKRAVKYAGFIETDDVYQSEWGIPAPQYDGNSGKITNWDEIMALLYQKSSEIYGTSDSDDYTSPNNALNRFVAYHFIDGGAPLEDYVHHFNEFGYNYGTLGNQSTNYNLNVWDYYTTKGQQRSLIKITQTKNGNFYLNRISEYNTEWGTGDYQEKGVVSRYENNAANPNGLNIAVTLNNNGGENGYYFPINHMLVYSDETRDALASERIRIDVTTMLPEMLSNSLRGKTYRYFPKGFFSNIMNESTGTEIYYLQCGYTGVGERSVWKDYQGDEFILFGQYDIVLKLPPVPVKGTYELRMASSNNDTRSMVQVYIGTDPYSNVPCGLPIDQRITVSSIEGDPFVEDEDNNNDETLCRESDRNLRNQNYMKGPNYFCNGKGTNQVRNIKGDATDGPALRRILTVQEFDPDKTYYLRLKSALSSSKTQMYLDYFEFVPKSVYDGDTPEDIW